MTQGPQQSDFLDYLATGICMKCPLFMTHLGAPTGAFVDDIRW